MKKKISNSTSQILQNKSHANTKPIKLESIPSYYNFASTLYKWKRLPKSENFIFTPDFDINNLISYIPRGDITNLSVDAIVSATNTDYNNKILLNCFVNFIAKNNFFITNLFSIIYILFEKVIVISQIVFLLNSYWNSHKESYSWVLRLYFFKYELLENSNSKSLIM